jgi:hypothetical protein
LDWQQKLDALGACQLIHLRAATMNGHIGCIWAMAASRTVVIVVFDGEMDMSGVVS